MTFKEWIIERWCSWFHDGGDIIRDSADRINWKCRDCGRWAFPVPLVLENKMIDRNIEDKLNG